MSVELVRIFDENMNAVGVVSRKQAEERNSITENVLVFVFNNKNQVWVQLRPKTKKHFPGCWDISACGGVWSSENHKQAAMRETREEMGFDVELEFVESFVNEFSIEGGVKKVLSHLYIGFSDKIPKTSEEVDEFKVWDVDELKEKAKKEPQIFVASFLLELDKAMNYTQRKNTNK